MEQKEMNWAVIGCVYPLSVGVIAVSADKIVQLIHRDYDLCDCPLFGKRIVPTALTYRLDKAFLVAVAATYHYPIATL